MTLLKSLGLSSPDQSKSDALADLVDATNTEQGITALGDALPITSTPSKQPELDQSIKDIFAQDTEEDYGFGVKKKSLGSLFRYADKSI